MSVEVWVDDCCVKKYVIEDLPLQEILNIHKNGIDVYIELNNDTLDSHTQRFRLNSDELLSWAHVFKASNPIVVDAMDLVSLEQRCSCQIDANAMLREKIAILTNQLMDVKFDTDKRMVDKDRTIKALKKALRDEIIKPTSRLEKFARVVRILATGHM